MEQDAEIRNMFDWIRNNPELGQVDVCICNAGLEQLWLLHGPYFDSVASCLKAEQFSVIFYESQVGLS